MLDEADHVLPTLGEGHPIITFAMSERVDVQDQMSGSSVNLVIVEPVLALYVAWLIRDACRKGISALFFFLPLERHGNPRRTTTGSTPGIANAALVAQLCDDATTHLARVTARHSGINGQIPLDVEVLSAEKRRNCSKSGPSNDREPRGVKCASGHFVSDLGIQNDEWACNPCHKQ